MLYRLSDQPYLYISAVSLYELYMGATTKEKEHDVKMLTEDLTVLPFTDAVSIKAAQIYHRLRLNNQMIEFRDIFIAATCIVNELPIVTFNKKHFKRIEGLKITR
ncbi:type II toxin-antitoxin system VapC family toxin [Olivibacter sp. SDN3]|uniref:type II toxin-antitoxin system VapC family toxin n=1 Tax=Olivibacter sp. SDN3 TaxID=2764720 RepID=UPI0021020673|nr:type II toxin-antitoxin system VapC family toxin [Olivibacter sp. SDN3]